MTEHLPPAPAVGEVQPADQVGSRNVLVLEPGRIQFSIRQQHRIDSLALAGQLAGIVAANRKWGKDGEPEDGLPTADSILADAEKFYTYLAADDDGS